VLATSLEVRPKVRRLPEQQGDMPVTCADLSKAIRLLGYVPKIPFHEGAREFADWYRSEHRR
jgi:UDP-glucuronate 4-epimerase